MRFLLRSFALLDLVSLVFLGMQLWEIAPRFNEITKQSDKVEASLMFPMFLLIVIGAAGLLLTKKFGFILYYIQFPFRLYLWIFSVGFITLLPEAFESYDDRWFEGLLKVCFTIEFIRLYLTIRMHFKLKDQQSHLSPSE